MAAGLTFFREFLATRMSRPLGFGDGLILCAAFVVARIGLVGWPSIPPVEATQWLVVLVPVLGAVGLIETRMSRYGWILGVRALVSFATVGLLLKARADHVWSPVEYSLWIGGAGSAVLFCWSWVAHLGAGTSRPWSALSLVVVLVGESVVLALCGSALLAQLCGAAAVALFALSGIRKNNRGSIAQELVAPVLWLGSVLAILGHIYAYLPFVSGVLLLLSLCTPGMWSMKSLRARGDAQTLALNLVVIVGFFAVLIWLNWPEQSAYDSAW